MDIASLEAEASRLIFPRFEEAEALALGLAMLAMAQAGALKVVINIRSANRTLFHAALPGSSANNDTWARRKSNTALHFGVASLLVGTRLRLKAETLSDQGLALADYADHGGAVPIRVTGAGVVAVATVSGLPQLEDHALVVRAMAALLAP